MARVFIDTNFVIESIGLRKSEMDSKQLEGHAAFISPLTIHTMCYAFKINIPDKRIDDFVNQVQIIDFTKKMVELALLGPTSDFEDNVQLHSADSVDANYFLTNDKELLDLKVFGQTKIVDRLR